MICTSCTRPAYVTVTVRATEDHESAIVEGPLGFCSRACLLPYVQDPAQQAKGFRTIGPAIEMTPEEVAAGFQGLGMLLDRADGTMQ